MKEFDAELRQPLADRPMRKSLLFVGSWSSSRRSTSSTNIAQPSAISIVLQGARPGGAGQLMPAEGLALCTYAFQGEIVRIVDAAKLCLEDKNIAIRLRTNL
jgi:hypothetical protein